MVHERDRTTHNTVVAFSQAALLQSLAGFHPRVDGVRQHPPCGNRRLTNMLNLGQEVDPIPRGNPQMRTPDTPTSAGEVWGGHQPEQLFVRQVGVADQGHRGRHYFPQVVRRDVGGHADGDPGGAVDQENLAIDRDASARAGVALRLGRSSRGMGRELLGRGGGDSRCQHKPGPEPPVLTQSA